MGAFDFVAHTDVVFKVSESQEFNLTQPLKFWQMVFYYVVCLCTKVEYKRPLVG